MAPMRPPWRLAAFALLALANAGACVLYTNGLAPIDGDDGGAADGATADVAGGDATRDAGPLFDGAGEGGGAHTIATSGMVPTASGLAQQTHVVYAEGDQRFWLFWIDSANPMRLKSSVSSDFVTWTETAGSLVLPYAHANEGGGFSVDYANVNGHDVVHVTIGVKASANDRRRYHARATLADGGIEYGVPLLVSSATDPTLIDPDGTVTRIGSDLRVTDVSGWAAFGGGLGTGNESA